MKWEHGGDVDKNDVEVGAAIEARRSELGLTAHTFAVAAGVTPQGLRPLRDGVRKNYQDKVKLGVARALHWPDDAVDRLFAGERDLPTVLRPDEGATPVERRLDRLEDQVAEVKDLVRDVLARLPEAP